MHSGNQKPRPQDLAQDIYDLWVSTNGPESPINDITMNPDERRRFLFSSYVLCMVYLSLNTWQSDGELPGHTLDTHVELIKLAPGYDDIRTIGDYFIDPVEIGYLPTHLKMRWQLSSGHPIEQKQIPLYMLLESASTIRFTRVAVDVQKKTGGPMEASQIVNTSAIHLMTQVFSFPENTQDILMRVSSFSMWACMLLSGMLERTETYT